MANENDGGTVIVILAERDKEEMERDIAQLNFDFMGTHIICRSGCPLNLTDLKRVSVSKARAIIVLACEKDADQSDARAFGVVLSLKGIEEDLSGHVVVEMRCTDNEPPVKLVGGDQVETIVTYDMISRILSQCAIHPGLAKVWEDLLGFQNGEFYMKRWPQLDGKRFEEVLISFPEAIPCGVKVAAEAGRIILNPDDDYVLKEGDEILVIADDAKSYAPGYHMQVSVHQLGKTPLDCKKILLCGWCEYIGDIILALDAFLDPGSEVWIFNEIPALERRQKLADDVFSISALKNIKLDYREGEAFVRRDLESLPLETFDSILIIADESMTDFLHSDSRSLATILLIRSKLSKCLCDEDAESRTPRTCRLHQAYAEPKIICEILSSRTRNWFSVSGISDYVLSNELVSMAIAMIAEDKRINRVFAELFSGKGNRLAIRQGTLYLSREEDLCFYEIMARGRERREIVIGYLLENVGQAVINPPNKSWKRKWSPADVFIVIYLEE